MCYKPQMDRLVLELVLQMHVKSINGCKDVPKFWKWCFRSTWPCLLLSRQLILCLPTNTCKRYDGKYKAGRFGQILCLCTGDQVKGCTNGNTVDAMQGVLPKLIFSLLLEDSFTLPGRHHVQLPSQP